jgi:hypothetical protein
MFFTNYGYDYIEVDEENFKSFEDRSDDKIHIIKLDFKFPTIEKLNYIIKKFEKTNRFVIERDIKFYNDYFKKINKKYYIMNRRGDKLISFFKRNNKVLLNINRLYKEEKRFVLDFAFLDVIRNTEVIIINNNDFENIKFLLRNWNGNVILYDK